MATTSNIEALTEKMVSFINEIGIPCKENNLSDDTFLPGLDISDGVLYYDAAKMKYPGDLLHEAGHIAVLNAEDRKTVSGPDKINGDLDAGAAEMGAIAWSWAALKHLDLPEEVVFHENGYKGGSESLVSSFRIGSGVGYPILRWLRMTDDNGQNFPAMCAWLRP